MLDIAVAALAMVLVVSGVLKVRDPEATVPMLAAVGLPGTRPLVYGVAAAEIVIGAVALVIGGPVAVAALGLLYAGFAVVSLVLLRSDEVVPCGCFGQRSATVTPLHVGVNAVAALVGLAAAALGAPGLYAASDDRSAAVVAVATVAAALLAAAVVALLTGAVGRLGTGPAAARPDELALDPERAPTATGASAPVAVSGVSPDGAPVTVPVAGTGHVTLLAFLTSGCTTCLRFWDAFGAPGGVELPGDGTELVIVTRSDDRENPNRVRELAPADHRLVRSSAAWDDYGVTSGPYVVLVDGRRDRILGEGAATVWEDVVAIVAQAVEPAPRRPGPPLPAPGVAE